MIMLAGRAGRRELKMDDLQSFITWQRHFEGDLIFETFLPSQLSTANRAFLPRTMRKCW